MKAMLWKEIRQNLKWALLGLLGMAVAMIFTAKDHLSAFFGYDVSGMHGPNVVTAVGAPAVGALLGALQIFAESRQDQWAFLVHRPISRTRIWLAKVGAGLTVYFAVTLLPWLCAWGWIAAPGHVAAPFDARLMLAGLADILAGSAWYFAAMLVAMREARWYGSRIMPAGLALIASMCAVLWPEFWHTIASSAIISAALAVGAWGSFVAGGAARPQPLIARFAGGLAISSGITLAGMLSIGLLSNLVPDAQREFTYTQHAVMADGELVSLTHNQRGDVIAATDMEGKPLPRYAHVSGNELYRMMGGRATLNLGRMPAGLEAMGRYPGYRAAGRYFPWVGITARTYWCFSPRLGYLVGYDQITARQTGTMGPDGFHAAGEEGARQRFAGELLSADLWMRRDTTLPMTNGLWRVGPGREITLLFAAPPGEALVGEALLEESHKQYFVAASSSRLWLLPEEGGEPIGTAPIRHGPPQYQGVTVSKVAQDRLVLRYDPSWLVRHDKAGTPVIFEFYSSSGKLERSIEAPTMATPGPTLAWDWHGLVALVMPLVIVAAAALVATMASGPSLAAEIAANPTPIVIMGVMLLVSAVSSAAMCYWLARRYAFAARGRVMWGFLGFILGPLGVLLFLSLHDLPARIPCPSCGKKRIVSRDLCEHCGAPFSPPPPKGIEIFSAPEHSPAVSTAM